MSPQEVTVSAPRVSGMPDPVSRWDPGRSSSSMDQYALEGAGPAGPTDYPLSIFRGEGVLDQPDARAPSQTDTKEPPGGACGTPWEPHHWNPQGTFWGALRNSKGNALTTPGKLPGTIPSNS